LQVRRAGIKLPLLVLGYTPAEAADVLAENDIAQCAYSAEYCAALSENAVKSGVKVKIHVKVDTGMSRLGFYFQDIERDQRGRKRCGRSVPPPGAYPGGHLHAFCRGRWRREWQGIYLEAVLVLYGAHRGA